jgi:hypothetical protein
MYNHLGGGHRMAGKRSAMVLLFAILANDGNYCQIRCPEDQVGQLRRLLLEKIREFQFDHEECGDFIYVGKGRIEIAAPKKLRGGGR